jgi:hypothetical protein
VLARRVSEIAKYPVNGPLIMIYFSDDLTSRLTRTQNRELSFRCIASTCIDSLTLQ